MVRGEVLNRPPETDLGVKWLRDKTDRDSLMHTVQRDMREVSGRRDGDRVGGVGVDLRAAYLLVQR